MNLFLRLGSNEFTLELSFVIFELRPLYIEGYCYFPLWLLVLIKKLAETFMSSQVSGNEVKLEWFLKWLVTHNLNFQYVIKTKLISSENQMQNTPCVVDSFKVG